MITQTTKAQPMHSETKANPANTPSKANTEPSLAKDSVGV
jgi:hypothetical protein